MKEYLALLGMKCRDVVTGAFGVVTSVSFDLYGCVQALLTLPSTEQKESESCWFDAKRLRVMSDKPVMDQPTFEIVPGGYDLPHFPEKPLP
jgi:hypothetical protein